MSIKDSVFQFTLTGVTPLLMHRDDVAMSDLLNEWRKDPDNKNKSKPGDDRSPGWTWQTYLYFDEATGKVAMPQAVIMASLRHAGAAVILSKQTTYKSMTQSGLMIAEEHVPFFTTTSGKPESVTMADLESVKDSDFTSQSDKARKLGFRLDVRRAAIGQSKHVRVRPRFDHWMVTGVVNVIDPDFKEEALKQIFDIAGQRKGIGDYRPGCKTPGPYGRFKAELKKVA